MQMHRLVPALALLFLGGAGGARAQAVRLPQPDKDGWIKLFRGDNPGDFYIANNGGRAPALSKAAFPNTTYTGQGDTLKVTGTPSGQIYFNQSFSHYRVSYQMRFPGAVGNCGMLFHVQENDNTTNGFPRSVESQGDPRQGMGQLWPIGDVWVTIRARVVNNRLTYDPAAPRDTVYGARNWDSRVIAGRDGWARPDFGALAARTGWVTQEAEVHGNDSIMHIVNDTVRIKYREPRVSSGGTPNNVTKRLSAGLIGWQAEGTAVWYRDIKIRLLPGDPLYTPTYAEFRERNTPRPMPARRILLLEDGALGFRAAGPGIAPLFDAAGRRRPGMPGNKPPAVIP